jgi:HSP20 family protein
MDLVPFKPFGTELSNLRKEMDKVWNRFFEDSPSRSLLRVGRGWEPMSDISETKDKLIVKAELPGMEAKDIDISLTDDILVIKGEKKQESEEKDENHFCVERYYGSFQRMIRLPVAVKSDKIEAKFKKGILTITMPKISPSKRKEIKIKVK